MPSSTKINPVKPVRYMDIADALRDRIQRGELRIGEKLPSYSELSNSSGAATYTIDRAYSVLEREGLIERRARSGVYVARPGTGRVQDVIGFVGSALSDYRHHPYFADLLSGIQQELDTRGMQVLLIGGRGTEVKWEKIGGVLLFEAQRALEVRIAQLPPGMPAVSCIERSERQSISSVTADDYGGTHSATRALIEQGHRRIAYLISDQVTSELTKRRVAGYQDALSTADIEFDARWQHTIGQFEPRYDHLLAGRKSMQAWLETDWRELGCTAMLCQNDEVAVGAMQTFREAGIRVPDDVSVVGFDDQRICTLVSPALSSVRVPLHDIGARAARLLLEQMRSDTDAAGRETQSIVLPTELHFRESSGGPPARRDD